jgi:L,D-peptidoglycan transpeptidase YkuD (ErfK/YbiS/YcfS/YnhG family)
MDSRKAASAAAVAGLVLTGAGCSASGSRTASVATTVTSAPATSTAASSTTATSSTTRVPAPTTVPSSPPVTAARPVSAATVAPCPANLASKLRSTGSARQLITVEAAGWSTTYAEVELWQKVGACWESVAGPWSGRIGENGFSDQHREGDGTTPTGMYRVGPVMYGNAPNPGVHEQYVPLQCGDWWDEDPTSAEYNTFQQIPCNATPSFGGGSEALWKETAPYPSFAVIDFNTDPVVPYVGSAIFFHADIGTATSGCISVPLSDLDRALDWIQPGQDPVFVMGPAQEIAGF